MRRLVEPACLPLAALVAAASLPVVFLLARLGVSGARLDVSALVPTAAFALGGASMATAFGGAAGIAGGLLAIRGRRLLVAGACILLAAPPAFWWIGITRIPGVSLGAVSGMAWGTLVAGLTLSPVPMLLVLAALSELPANVYAAARVALPPARRFRLVLLPLLNAPLVGGFLLTAILLLGESEVPFLLGFRTTMTDVVTAFAGTFDLAGTLPLAVPLVVLVLLLGTLAVRPILRSVFPTSRGGHGVTRQPARFAGAALAAVPTVLAALSLAGYLLAAFARGLPRFRVSLSTLVASIGEPVACTWGTLLLVVAAAYPVRGSAVLRWAVTAGLLLFCIPAAIHGIGWIAIAGAVGGSTIPPLIAHASRTLGLPLLAFAIAYARLPRSLEDAARLARISPLRRATGLVLPLLAPSLVAACALAAALVFADRDVASLLLAPGSSRLMLDLYLVSANAPSTTVGAAALAALAGAAVTLAAAALGPLALWRRRG